MQILSVSQNEPISLMLSSQAHSPDRKVPPAQCLNLFLINDSQSEINWLKGKRRHCTKVQHDIHKSTQSKNENMELLLCEIKSHGYGLKAKLRISGY